ncbi:hypothetical protein ZIOFF_022609 [Zingiber officinale]|uniref:Uncharacterized protein n=1 Tax=Zingiber officinale TaxID=94328 RepID=A0A8J5H9V8_ZINOF|nr:hypothetical protein ZIOFF_022609 [Zingiber officinale]
MSLHKNMSKSYSLVNIPFSWENQPGISKVIPQEEEEDDNKGNTASPMQEGLYPEPDEKPKLIKLPPPPCQKRPQQPLHGGAIYVPLPPCAFQSMPMTIMTTEGEGGDPFLAAYMECTKSRRRKMDAWSKIRKRISLGFGCGSKWACEVKEDTMIRLHHQDQY